MTSSFAFGHSKILTDVKRKTITITYTYFGNEVHSNKILHYSFCD